MNFASHSIHLSWDTEVWEQEYHPWKIKDVPRGQRAQYVGDLVVDEHHINNVDCGQSLVCGALYHTADGITGSTAQC